MEPKRAKPRAADPLEVEEAAPTGVRVETDEQPAPNAALALEYSTDREAARKPLPGAEWLGIGAVAFGLGLAALGVLIVMVGLSMVLDPWSRDWGDGLAMGGVGMLLGVLPGLVSSGLGVRRIREHLLLRRLVALARGNDSVDVTTLARLLEIDPKPARRLALDAIGQGLLDARFDTNGDRLILRARASPFR